MFAVSASGCKPDPIPRLRHLPVDFRLKKERKKKALDICELNAFDMWTHCSWHALKIDVLQDRKTDYLWGASVPNIQPENVTGWGSEGVNFYAHCHSFIHRLYWILLDHEKAYIKRYLCQCICAFGDAFLKDIWFFFSVFNSAPARVLTVFWNVQ